jgi:hypothetical protein
VNLADKIPTDLLPAQSLQTEGLRTLDDAVVPWRTCTNRRMFWMYSKTLGNLNLPTLKLDPVEADTLLNLNLSFAFSLYLTCLAEIPFSWYMLYPPD